MSNLVPLLHDLLDQSVDWLNTRGLTVTDQEIVTGDLAWDQRCGGYVFLRLPSVVPAGEEDYCPTALVTTSLYLGVMRCQDGKMDGKGNPPSTDKITTDSLTVIADMEQVLNFLCAFDWSAYGVKKNVIQWTALGPDGQMMGGEWQVDVNLIPDCGC